jgi:dTDP-4-dehydrorhamnose reductase
VGEEIVRSSNVLYTIVRPSAIYGLGGSKKSFAEYVAERLSREVPALADQYVSPTYNRYLAEAIARVLELRPLGTLHVAGERASRYEFALAIAELLGLAHDSRKALEDFVSEYLARRGQ